MSLDSNTHFHKLLISLVVYFNYMSSKIVIITSSLSLGGSEKVLYNLCKEKIRSHIQVINLSKKQFYSQKLESIGVKVYNLSISKYNFISKLIDIILIIKKSNPEIIQTWMYHADLISVVIKPFFINKNFYWGIRNGSKKLKLTTSILIRVLSIFSYFIPRKIISCSKSSTKMHEEFFYCKKKIITILNGVDTSRYYKNISVRNEYRNRYNIKDDNLVISMVARWDPQKDHDLLLNAFQKFTQKFEGKYVLFLAGLKITKDNHELLNKISKLNIKDKTILAGEVEDTEYVYNLSDISILCSTSGEGFPNVISESMACGTICIATNSGDVELIINKFGWVIEEGNLSQLLKALAEAKNEISDKENWINKSNNSIMHIKSNFTIQTMVNEYCKVWNLSL